MMAVNGREVGARFQIVAGVRRGCALSPTILCLGSGLGDGESDGGRWHLGVVGGW